MQDATNHIWMRALAAGAVGALTLTAVHQLAKRVSSNAPRMDVLGERAIARSVEALRRTPPAQPALHRWALAGDLLANSAYYSLIACGREPRVWARAVPLGLAAGVGALLVPQPMGLGHPPHSEQLSNQAMTVSWYLLGALATALTFNVATRRTGQH